ncbi:MAG: type II toxin-antitoxin system VapC family toxin [Alphaproteobacteria bacterium]|nr:type II toxin-antitoxin system VapC family toxin [Alphaproteobacteria bacterium]
MTMVVLDASALIAMLKHEPGAEVVERVIADSKISAINYAEVVSHFCFYGMPANEVDRMLSPLPMTIIAADAKLARVAGHLRNITASAGLSLGDRFCLALAKMEDLTAFTADRSWQTIADQAQLRIKLIR